MIIECTSCGNPHVENKELMLCASCNSERRKNERASKKVKVVRQAMKVTPKRAGELQEYYKLRREYLDTHPCCEVEECHDKSKEIHHKKGRENGLLLDVNYFMGDLRKASPRIYH